MKLVLLGHISGAHGLKGEVLVITHTAAPEGIAAYGPLSDENGGRPLDIEVIRVTARGVIARIAGVTDRTAAEGLKGRQLYVDRDRLGPVEENEFYLADLVGLQAFDPAGTPIGEVVAVHNFGAGDIIEIRLANGSGTELVPFTKTFVPDVDVEQGRLVIQGMEIPDSA